MSIPSISSNSIETFSFEENFVLPEDPNINVPLSTRMDLLGKVIGLGLIGVGAAGFTFRPTREFYSTMAVILIWNASIYIIATGISLLLKESYHSPNIRKKYREELEQGKISLQDFIYKHGWERILTFGFHLSDDAEPLITKKHFSKFADKATQDLDKGFRDLFNPTNLLYPLKTTDLWLCLEYNLTTRKQKELLAKEFVKRIDSIPTYSFVKNWQIIQNLGWDERLSEEKRAQLNTISNSSRNILKNYCAALKEVIEIFENQSKLPPPLSLIPFFFRVGKIIHHTFDPEYTMLSNRSILLNRLNAIDKEQLKRKAVYLGLDDKLLELQKSYQIFNEEFPKE